jgi:DNA-directed RNA polymerase subunit RPC12/RpoP
MDWLPAFIVALMVNVALSFLVAYVAGQKGRSGTGFFWLSFFMGFLIALIVAIALPPIGSSSATPGVRCPYCAEEILAEAIVCKHCGRDVERTASQESIEEIEYVDGAPSFRRIVIRRVIIFVLLIPVALILMMVLFTVFSHM